jgi:hypothetical protein
MIDDNEIAAEVAEELRKTQAEMMQEAREDALNYREEFEKQDGEADRTFHAEMAAAASVFHLEMVEFEEYVDDYPEMDALCKELTRFDGHVADNPATPAWLYADCIGELDRVYQEINFEEAYL